MNKLTIAMTAALSLGLLVMDAAQAAGRFHAGGSAVTEQGAVSGRGAAVRGPNGGGMVRGRGAAIDSQGNFVSGGGGAFNTGTAQGVRAGRTTGTVGAGIQHQSGMAVQGVRGSATSSGAFNTDGAGGASGSRTTSANSSSSGASYTGSTSYERGSGANHTSSCTDYYGNPVSCSRP
ncbi:MAG: hypothetical protein H6974_08820 [Gammaproteobacteria bacterium]|nr:hypothetical protein [Gammaproteobacteria bacterium]MCP5196871.1 hypothetical protein [Gammaproteobacteria bacterium]